jgi:Restriction endonuclease S subunits
MTEEFGSLITELRNGVSPKPNQAPPGIPILRINAARPGQVSLDTERYLPDAEDLLERFAIRDGDLLFTRYNGSIELLGVCGMVRGLGNRTMLYPDKLIRVRTNARSLLPSYAELYFQSTSAREGITADAKSSAGQQGISGADLKRQPVLVPPVVEQKEIVRRVDRVMVLIDRAEARLAAASLRADRLATSILEKAFAGELVPTEAELARREDREYKPASVLLARIENTRVVPARGSRRC